MTDREARARRTRRGNGDGSFRQREDGRWEVRFVLPDGSRKSRYGKTRVEARDKMRTALRDHEQGKDLGAPRQTVKQFLEQWLEDVVRPTKARKTYHSYADHVRLHLIPALGRHQLDKLSAQHVAAMLRAMSDEGLAPRTVHHARAVLRNALNWAIKTGLLVRNPAALVDPPRLDDKEVEPFPPEEARAVLAAVEGDRLGAAFRVAMTLGLREGEVLGLSWADVDLDANRLRVRQALQRIDGALILKEPKSDKSRRTLHLPRSLVAALRAHRDRQAFDKAAAGEAWRDTGLVFTTRHGTPVDPRNLIRSWHRLLDASAIPRRPFHTSRHTAASLLIAEGVPMKVVQEILGHSMLSTTADIYGHLFPAAFQEAAEAMERALGGQANVG